MVGFNILRSFHYPSHSLLSLSFLHLFSSVPQPFNFFHHQHHRRSPTVCLLLWKVLLGEKSADINTGEAPCWVWHYKAVAQIAPLLLTPFSCLAFENCSRTLDDSSQTHTLTETHNTTRTWHMDQRDARWWQHMWHPHPSCVFCCLFVLHKIAQSCHPLFRTTNNLWPVVSHCHRDDSEHRLLLLQYSGLNRLQQRHGGEGGWWREKGWTGLWAWSKCSKEIWTGDDLRCNCWQEVELCWAVV